MKYGIQQILVPTDFSEHAKNAVRIAVTIAKRHNAAIHLLNIVPNQQLPPTLDRVENSLDNMAAAMVNAKQLLEQCVEKLQARNSLNVFSLAEFGSVDVNASNYVVKNNIDLVVMGTHGISGWKDFFIGSNAMSTIKSCICPVLTIPDAYKKSTFDSVLYPVRDVDGVVEKFDYIKAIVEANNSKIHLLGITEEPDITSTNLFDKLKAVRDTILTTKNSITYEIQTCPDIADKILSISHHRNDDLIVINATLDKDWTEYFSGNFTQRIVNYSTIPVISIRL